MKKNAFLFCIVALAGDLQAGSTTEERQFISNPRQLIYDGKRSGEGYFSEDGKKLIFQSEREEGNPFYQYIFSILKPAIPVASRRVSGKQLVDFSDPAMRRLFLPPHILIPRPKKNSERNSTSGLPESNAAIRGTTTTAWIFLLARSMEDSRAA